MNIKIIKIQGKLSLPRTNFRLDDLSFSLWEFQVKKEDFVWRRVRGGHADNLVNNIHLCRI